MERYSEYKDSGVQWIGEIPSHWGLRKMKYCFKERSQKGYSQEPLLSATQNQGVIRKDMYENRTVEAIKNLETLKLVEVGDFVISLRSFQGRIEYSYCRGIISPAYTILTPTDVTASYFKYLGKSLSFISLLKSTVTGIREGQNIDYGKLRTNMIPMPSLEEQQSIASYLDKVTAKIDEAIVQQQRMIDLLSERKRIIIHNAVTKGLNPNILMKDSGIDWIGKIPEHWNIIKTSYVYTNIGSGTTPRSGQEDYYSDEGISFLQTGDLNDGYITTSLKKITPKALNDLKLKIYRRNSLVIAMYGATIGKLGILDIDSTVNQACCVLSENKNMEVKYSFYYFMIAKPDLIMKSKGGGQPNISQETIKNERLLIPPLEEQKEIADYIDKICLPINTLISNYNRQLLYLQEHKQIIINDVVTGKVKVS